VMPIQTTRRRSRSAGFQKQEAVMGNAAPERFPGFVPAHISSYRLFDLNPPKVA